MGLNRVAKAAFIFNAAWVWSAALAELLGASVGGVAVTRADIADALRLAALKLAAGDTEFVLTSLVGQAAVLQRLTEEAAADMQATDRLDMKSVRLRNYLALSRQLQKVLSAIAAMQKREAT